MTGPAIAPPAPRFSTDSVCYWDRRRVVSPPLDDTPSPSRCRASGRRNLVMDKVWSINVKVPQGYQWWHVAYDAEADARIAIAKACPEAQIVEATRASNAFQVKDGASYQLPNTRHLN